MYVLNKIKWICFSIFTIGCFFACSDDQPERVITGTGGDAAITLRMYTPSASLPQATRSSDIDENKINEVKILVLEQSGSEFVYDYMEDGTQIQQDQANSQYTTFTADLWSSDDLIKLILIANYNDAFTSGLTKGMSEANLKSLLVDTFDPDMGGNLPLYGEKELPNLDSDTPQSINVTMLRAVARVDVNNHTTNVENIPKTQPFELRSVHVYRANNKLQLIPDEEAFVSNTSMTVKSPTVPADAAFRNVFSREEPVAVDAFTKIYVPEADSVTGSAQVDGAICIVVGGIYADDDKETYYRIDFNSGIAGHPFGQVLRNYKYIFNIVQVNDRGEETPGEASEKEEVSITATVQIWDEVTSEMYFGCNCDNNYLGISSRKVVMPYYKDAADTIYLKSTLPFTIQALDTDNTPTGNPINSPGQTLSNGFYTVQLVQDSENEYQLLLTTTGENKTDDNFSGKFLVSTELWQMDVTVEQETYKMLYRDKIVNVLTITSLRGDLGTSDGIFEDGISGVAMRKVLENANNFSHSGTVPIKGIIVHSFTNDMISSSDAATMAILAKMLEHVDVVHLPADCSPSLAASNLIYNWVMAKYYRVLFLGVDNEQTNSYLQERFTDDGDWVVIASTDFEMGVPYQDDEGTEPFFYGPFGTVNQGAIEVSINDGFGYNDGFRNLIPLLRILNRSTDNFGKVTHGVNPDAGVFYFGESEVTSSRGKSMSTNAENNGTVYSEFDKMMANLWAWVVDRVVIGIDTPVTIPAR
ncbi:MAG: FimB/Mfa2 family fimbrial subunit [Tannerellaceae bacterium]|nr:FimB/Mfa2 family fimbrial subunit [Tannerellaceae bacterium]